MRIGFILGMVLGIVFLKASYELVKRVRCFKYNNLEFKEKYHDKGSGMLIKVASKLGLDWLILSKPVQQLFAFFDIVLILLCFIGLFMLLRINSTSYGEVLNWRF